MPKRGRHKKNGIDNKKGIVLFPNGSNNFTRYVGFFESY